MMVTVRMLQTIHHAVYNYSAFFRRMSTAVEKSMRHRSGATLCKGCIAKRLLIIHLHETRCAKAKLQETFSVLALHVLFLRLFLAVAANFSAAVH